MKIPSIVGTPWWAQAGLCVLGIVGSVAVNYIQLERERNALSIETDEDEEEA